jgi:carboxymethylenebutenolidase
MQKNSIISFFSIVLFSALLSCNNETKKPTLADPSPAAPMIKTQTLNYALDTVKMNGFIAYDESFKTRRPVVLVVHEWWGLNDYIKQEAEIFAAEMGDVDVYAVDLYDGEVAQDVPTAQKLMSGLKQERAAAIVNGIIAKVGAYKSIATIGWCMGGAWSLQSTLLETKQAKACVMYYGMPEKNVERLKTLNCDVLGIFAKQDQFINAELVKTFEANMKTANKKLTVYNYEADHAFANPSNPKHNKEFAADAHAKVLAFLKFKLK